MNTIDIDWKKFDKIYCIHYLPYKERLTDIQNTFKTLGILPYVQWYYTTDNFLFDALFDILVDKDIIFTDSEQNATIHNSEGYIKNNKVFNLAINSYNLIKQAYELGYENILILEDDITFLKDKQLVKEYIDDFPMNYDIVSMDYWFRNDNDKYTICTPNRKINDYYQFLSKERIVNASCVYYSRFGMKHVLDGMDYRFMNSDYFIANQETYDDWKIKRAVSKIPLCIQRQEYEMNHVQDMKWNYGKTGIKLNIFDNY